MNVTNINEYITLLDQMITIMPGFEYYYYGEEYECTSKMIHLKSELVHQTILYETFTQRTVRMYLSGLH